MFKVKENDLFSKNMSGSELYKTTKMGKKYTQKPAEKPGGMILLELIEAEEEMDKFLNKLITKNGTTEYQYVREKTKNNSNDTIYNTGDNSNSTIKLFNN